jgi:hypothetical protein
VKEALSGFDPKNTQQLMTNKGERQRMTKLKFLKRLKKYCLLEDFRRGKGNFFVFKSTGSPCSCEACAGEKYSRKVKHKGSEIPEE